MAKTRQEAMAYRERLLRRHQELCHNVPEVMKSGQEFDDSLHYTVDLHKHAVAVAIVEGKPVSEAVIKNVPDLWQIAKKMSSPERELVSFGGGASWRICMLVDSKRIPQS